MNRTALKNFRNCILSFRRTWAETKENQMFLKTRVEYLGYCIDADGLHKSPAKVKAIVEAPEPQNQQQLRSFLGLVNYYGKFISSLSTITHPLNQLLCQQTRWKWSQECEQAFRN